LLDEIDAGNPNVLAALNSALANNYCAFPDGMVKRHDNFRVIAAANTFGSGANIVYAGRNPIDGATKDRFVFIDFDIDENMERQIAGNDTWVNIVQTIRKEMDG